MLFNASRESCALFEQKLLLQRYFCFFCVPEILQVGFAATLIAIFFIMHSTPLPVFLTLFCLGPLVLMHLLLMWVDICVETLKNSQLYDRHAYYSKLTRGLSSVTIFLCGTSLNIWQKSQGPFPLWAFLYTSFSFFPQGGAIFCLHSFFNWWTYHSNHMAHANEEP